MKKSSSIPWMLAHPQVHWPRTRILHLSLSLDIFSCKLHICQVSHDFSSCLHVFLGLPCFLFPCGFHVIDRLAILFFGFLSVCPIHFHFLSFIWVSSRAWSARLQISSFLTLSCHLMFRILLRQLFTNV